MIAYDGGDAAKASGPVYAMARKDKSEYAFCRQAIMFCASYDVSHVSLGATSIAEQLQG